MDKSSKLQRYTRKDYSELVDFPVEIVGRDGVVRRYSFEDSIRLYQRRITFAPIRYRDSELVQAEVGHCRSRIDQLRRSYFHRYGWGTPEGDPTPEALFGDLAGEIAAFLCRVLHSDGRPDLRLDPVDDNGTESTWYVLPRTASSGMLLYIHRFEGEDADRIRETFFAQLKGLERLGRVGGDSETLLAFHHTVDCGFILTGRGHEFESLTSLRDEDGDEVLSFEPTPWDRVMEIVRRGEYAQALGACRELTTDQPYHRSAYIAGALLAMYLGQPVVAEDFALLGSRYFPGSAALAYHLGWARLKLDRRDEGIAALKEAVRLEPGLVAARFVLVVELLERGRYGEARRALAGRRGHRPDDRRGESILARLEQWLRWRRVMVGAGAVSILLGIVATFLGGWIGLVPVAMGLGMALVGRLAFRRQLDRVVALQRFDEISYGLRQLSRRQDEERQRIS